MPPERLRHLCRALSPYRVQLRNAYFGVQLTRSAPYRRGTAAIAHLRHRATSCRREADIRSAASIDPSEGRRQRTRKTSPFAPLSGPSARTTPDGAGKRLAEEIWTGLSHHSNSYVNKTTGGVPKDVLTTTDRTRRSRLRQHLNLEPGEETPGCPRAYRLDIRKKLVA